MLIFLVRILVLGLAVGTVFIRLHLFKSLTDGQSMLIGIAATPMFVSLTDYLLGLIFAGWPSWYYFLIPLAMALLFFLIKKHYVTMIAACRSIWAAIGVYRKSIGVWAIFDCVAATGAIFCCSMLYNGQSYKAYALEIFRSLGTVGRLAAGLLVLSLASALGYFMYKMIKTGALERNLLLIAFTVVVGTSCMHALAMIDRPVVDSDRSHYELEARYFLEDKNSWEIDHYTDEKYGSSQPDDHGPLWIVYLADAEITADTIGEENSLRCRNFAIFWVFLCFNLFIFMVASYVGGTNRAGIVALILFHIYVHTLQPVLGSRDAFRIVGLLLLVLYVANQTEEISAGRAKWYEYLTLALFCFLSMNGHEGNVYIMLGMFIMAGVLLLIKKAPPRHLIACGASVLAGTLLGIAKTIQIYLSTGRLASSTALVFHDTPVAEQLIEINNTRADWTVIWATYTLPVRLAMLIGIIGLLVMLAVSWKKKENKTLIFSLVVIGMLLPMTGMMDWIGYDVSLWFAEQERYRMYFLMLFAITGSWLLTRRVHIQFVNAVALVICALGMYGFLKAEEQRCAQYSKSYLNACIRMQQDYEKIADIADSLTDGDVFTRNQVLLYYLHGTPKLLYHPYTEDLIQAKTDDEIEAAIEKLNVGAILLPESGLDYHDYSLLPFWEYINNSDSFSRITPEEGGYDRDYIIFYKNK